MPKYAEGTKSPSGKFVVREGQWVPLEAPGEANAIAGAQRRSNPQPRDAEFYGDPNSVESIRQAAEFGADSDAAVPALATIGTAMLPLGRIGGGAIGGYEGYKHGGIPGALGGAAVGAAGDKVAGPALRLLLGGKGGAVVKALRTLMGEAEAIAPRAETMSTTGAVAAEAAPAVGKAVSRSVLPVAEDAAASGAQKTVNTIMRDFAKKAAPEAKTGEKIWLKLGPDGLPLDVVTSGQAARLPQAAKTWVARTW